MRSDHKYFARQLWSYLLLNRPLKKSDMIIVLGTNDLRLADHAATLYKKGYASQILFSGGMNKRDDLLKNIWTEPEAVVFARRAIKQGVPKKAILLEKRSTNTGENIQFTSKILQKKGITLKSIIVVQKPFMERRAYATAKKYWPKQDIIATSPKITFTKYPTKNMPLNAIINLMVGEIQRIKEYPKKGFQIRQPIPKNVMHAYTTLREAGYNKHIMSTSINKERR